MNMVQKSSGQGQVVWPQVVLFDLDGTLIDSAGDLLNALNLTLGAEGLGPLSLDQVRAMIGDGVMTLVDRGFVAAGRPLTPQKLTIATERMMGHYSKALTVETVLLEGAAATVEELHRRGARLALITNKPTQAARRIVEHFGIGWCFEVVLGGDSRVPRKPAPDMLLLALSLMGATPNDAVMVGDSRADVAAAKAAGVRAVLVEGGYTNHDVSELGADIVVPSLTDLDGALGKLRG